MRPVIIGDKTPPTQPGKPGPGGGGGSGEKSENLGRGRLLMTQLATALGFFDCFAMPSK